MKTLKYALIGLGVILVPLGIYTYDQYKKALDTCYLTAGIVLHKFSTSLVSFTLLLKIRNFSDFAVKLENQLYEIYFMNVKVAEAKKENTEFIHANSCSPFSLEVSFSPTKVLSNFISSLSDIIKNKEKIKIKVVGTMDMDTMGFKKRGYKTETSFTLKELMDEESPSASSCKC